MSSTPGRIADPDVSRVEPHCRPGALRLGLLARPRAVHRLQDACFPFFRPDLNRRFTCAMHALGGTHLGCERISEPWLSC
jgi:hypothetical protein